MSDEDVDLDALLERDGKGAVTSDPTPTPGAPTLPPGVTAWDLNRRDPTARSYYTYAPDGFDPTVPTATERLDVDVEGERERAVAEQLGGGIVRALIEGKKRPGGRPTHGRLLPNGKPLDLSKLAPDEYRRYTLTGEVPERFTSGGLRLRLPLRRRA